LLRYQETTLSARRRWAAAGTSISSASQIESIAQELAAILMNISVPQEPIETISLLIGAGRLTRILDLPEAPKRRVYTHRGGQGRVEIEVSFEELLRDWLQGVDLITLANSHFRNVPDIDFRFEQLGDFIYDYFEIYFPWIFGTIIDWTNDILQEENVAVLLPKTIPANIRWGVDNPIALQLMIRGIQSRSLASRIAQRWSATDREGNVFDWIRSVTLAQWQQIFDASQAELRNILELSRNRKGGVAVDLIMNGSANLEFDFVIPEMEKTDAFLKLMGDSDLDPVCILVGEEVVGYIPSRDQSDIRSLMSTGLMISVRVSATSNHGLLELELVEPEE